MSTAEVEEKVKAIIVEKLGVEESEVTHGREETDLIEDAFKMEENVTSSPQAIIVWTY